jgi:organic hydroperoxide reductase OsmC/OhrA
MKITSRITNQQGKHTLTIETDGREQPLAIRPGGDGLGSSVNGGELLFSALATCYCNDLYREARKRGIELIRVRVEVKGDFTAEGAAASNITYRASVDAKAPEDAVLELMRHTDRVAEIHNTLRYSAPVLLVECQAREIPAAPVAAARSMAS